MIKSVFCMDGLTYNHNQGNTMHRHIIAAIIEEGFMLLRWSDGALEFIDLRMNEQALAE